MIDVRQLIASSSLEELNRDAEAYFSTLPDWTYHLSKPLSSSADAPALLISFGSILQGMRLSPGMRVLDFGAGTGWTSRFLTQLGCRVVVLDVSPTALELAAHLYERQPVFGDQPAPEFQLFDGLRIPLPDASVERILCFDSFHHVTDPELVLKEFARILTPGGIAAFVEPGPEHSKSPQSQFEMRTYGVIENDIRIEEIWEQARANGFDDLRLAALNIPPFHLSLDEFNDLLRGGESYLRWAESTRQFLKDVRHFFLVRAGIEPLDSRRGEGLKAALDVEMPSSAAADDRIAVRCRVTNEGSATWLPSGVRPGGVSLGCHLIDAAAGRVVEHDFHWEALTAPPRPIAPGESVELTFHLPALPSAGELTVEFDCVADGICWFAQGGSPSVRRTVRVS